MNSRGVLAGVGLTVALGGIVGGIAFAQTYEPARSEAPMVVVPAGQSVAVTGTPTVAASPSAVPVVKPVAPVKTSAPKPVAAKPAPVKVAAPVKKSTAPVSSKQTVVKKATTSTARSLTVASDPTPADPTPAQPRPEIAPNDPIRNTPPPPIMGNYTGGPVEPKEITPPPAAE